MGKTDLVPDWIHSWAAEHTELMTTESGKHSVGRGVCVGEYSANSRGLCHPLLHPHQPSGAGFQNFLNNLIE